MKLTNYLDTLTDRQIINKLHTIGFLDWLMWPIDYDRVTIIRREDFYIIFDSVFYERSNMRINDFAIRKDMVEKNKGIVKNTLRNYSYGMCIGEEVENVIEYLKDFINYWTIEADKTIDETKRACIDTIIKTASKKLEELETSNNDNI